MKLGVLRRDGKHLSCVGPRKCLEGFAAELMSASTPARTCPFRTGSASTGQGSPHSTAPALPAPKSDYIQPSDICRQRNLSGRPCRLMRQALQIQLNSKCESQKRSHLANQDSILGQNCHEKNCLKRGFTAPVRDMVLGQK